MSQQVRGHGKVELFDGLTGRTYRVEPFENVITDEMQNRMRWSSRAPYSAAWAGAAGDPEPRYLMNHLCAWPDSSAESASEKYPLIPADFVAYAGKSTYAQVGHALRGSINTVDSAFTSVQHKYVFEWPTNGGIGTFQSVGWVNLAEVLPVGFTTWQQRMKDPVLGPSLSGTALSELGFTIDQVADKLYAHTAITGVNGVREYNWTTGAVVSTLFTTTGEQTLAYDPTGTPGFWMVKSSSGTNPNIVKRNFAGTQVAQINQSGTALIGGVITKLVFDGTYLWAGNSSGNIVRINPADSTYTSFALGGPYAFGQVHPNEIATCVYVDQSSSIYRNILTTYGNLAATPASTNRWMVWNTSSTNSNPWYATFHRRNSTGMIYATHGSTSMQLFFYDPTTLSTRTRLASPVVKTGTQTMKITYTFDFS